MYQSIDQVYTGDTLLIVQLDQSKVEITGSKRPRTNGHPIYRMLIKAGDKCVQNAENSILSRTRRLANIDEPGRGCRGLHTDVSH